MKNRPMINRVFISLITAFSFLAMSLSGIAAFMVPQGKVAYWTHWSFLKLSKTDWGNIHITTSVLFLIAGIWHTWYNWSQLIQYLRGIPGRMSASFRDLAIAILVTLFFAVGAVTKTPPLNYILNFNNWIKESWVKTPAYDPPFGHAELLSIKGFCKKMYINTTAAQVELRINGITINDENQTLEQIALANRTTPAALYQIIKKLEQPEAVAPVAAAIATENVKPKPEKTALIAPTKRVETAKSESQPVVKPLYTGDIVIEKFEGKGIGKKSLTVICQELNLNCARVKQKLAAQQMVITDDETLKDAATRLGIVPIELLKTVLVGEPM